MKVNTARPPTGKSASVRFMSCVREGRRGEAACGRDSGDVLL